MRLRTLLLAAFVLCLAPASAGASVPALRGASTHPLSSTQADFDQELDLLQQAGANEVRIDIGWATLEGEAKGSYDPAYVAKADQFFADAHAHGLKVVATLWQTPCWASSAPASVKDNCSAGWWESPRNVQLYPPTNPQDFADAAAFVADRWGGDLAAIEVWNEPNYIPYFFNVPDRHTAEDQYAAMLNLTYPAVKAKAPNVAVIGPAMLDSDSDFLAGLYDRGFATHSDGVSLRPFNGGRDPRDTSVPPDGDAASFLLGVPHVRDVMAAHGDSGKQLWFTELGWSSCVNPPAPDPPISSWCVGEAKQAQYIADAYRIVRDRWNFVHLFSVYTLRNTGTTTSREDQMGMLRQDFDPKPAYDAFKAVLAEPVPAPPTVAGAASPPPPLHIHKAKPVLSKLRLSHGRLAYRLTQRARVTFTLQRVRHGRWARVRKPLVLKGRRGTNRLRLRTVLGKRRLAAGRYRLTLVARDDAGVASRPLRLRFRLR
jgi:hypothetical protein